MGAHGGRLPQWQYPNLWQYGGQRDLRVALTDAYTADYRNRVCHINAIVDLDAVADTHGLADGVTDAYTDV